MNIKASFRYMVRDLLRSVGWYYASIIFFVVTLNLFFGISSSGVTMNGVTMNGTMVSSSIFLFVIGLNTFAEYFGMLLQNGMSRKTFFVSRLLVFACIASLLVLGDVIFSIVLRLVQVLPFAANSLFHILYPPASTSPSLSLVVANLLINLMTGFLMLNVGACIVTMFYRLKSPFKAIVGAGVPVLLFIGFPFVDTMFFGGALRRSVLSGIDFAFGLSAGRPYMGILTLTLLAAVFAFLGWLLTRRATFRK